MAHETLPLLLSHFLQWRTKKFSSFCYHSFTNYYFSSPRKALTSTMVKKGGIFTGDVVVPYKYNKHVIDVKFDTESNLEVQYFHDHAAIGGAVTLNQSPAVDFSATIGTPSFAFGAKAGYETKSGSFTKYNAGVSVISPDYNASIVLDDKGDTLRASYVHYLDLTNKSAGVAEISRRFASNESTFTVGGLYTVDSLISVKVKLNNHGKLAALSQHELKPKSLLTISTEMKQLGDELPSELEDILNQDHGNELGAKPMEEVTKLTSDPVKKDSVHSSVSVKTSEAAMLRATTEMIKVGITKNMSKKTKIKPQI